jgi:hypothetical protein
MSILPLPPFASVGRNLSLCALTTARFRDAAYDVAAGRTYLSGTFSRLRDGRGGRSVAGVTRLHADGNRDQCFVVAFTGICFSSVAPCTLFPLGEDLSVGGSFTQVADADGASAVPALVRIKMTTGRLDRSWLPFLPGTDPVVSCLAMLQGEFGANRLAVGLAAAPFLLLCDPDAAGAGAHWKLNATRAPQAVYLRLISSSFDACPAYDWASVGSAAADVPQPCAQLPDIALSPERIEPAAGGTAQIAAALRNLCSDLPYRKADLLLSLNEQLQVTDVPAVGAHCRRRTGTVSAGTACPYPGGVTAVEGVAMPA